MGTGENGTEGGWEVVVRSKKERKAPVATNPSTVTSSVNVLTNRNKAPSSKTASFFTVPKDDEEDKEGNKDKVKKSHPKKFNEKKKDSDKPKQPKTLEQALLTISDMEMKDVCNTMALSDIARFLNSKLTVPCNEELYFNSLDYPLSIVPLKIKDSLLNAINSKSHMSSLYHCVEFCLSSIAYSMIKELPVAGYKIMIQCIANIDPKHFIQCIPKLNNLMNSFQNRPSIGLALLWSIGQGGLKNFDVGFEVWENSMLPMIEMKHYFRYIVDYLTTLIQVHSIETNAAKISLKPDDFLMILSFICTKRKMYSRDLEKTLLNQIMFLRILCFEKSDSWKNDRFLEKLLDELPDSYYSTGFSYDSKSETIIKIIVENLLVKESIFTEWLNLYQKNLKKSSHVLNYIENNWSTLPDGFNKKKFLKNVYQNNANNQKDSDIKVILARFKNIEKKSSGSKKGFPWIKGCFFLLLAIIGAAIAYDIQVSTSYEKSHTAHATKVALEYSNYGLSKSLSASARGYIWLENNAPHYYTAVVDFGRPYVVLGWDMALIVSNQAKEMYGNTREYVVEKWPLVRSSIDHYAPNALDTMCSYCCTAWKATKEFAQHYYGVTNNYLKTKVFIDNWAPEVLHAKTLEALNATKVYAVEYYNRFHQRVDHYSKL